MTLRPRSFFTASPCRRWLLAAAVLVVLAAQWLALVHTVVHAGGRALPGLETAAAPQGASSLVQRVAGHDAGSAACLLLDQLAHAAPWAEPPAALPLLLPPAGPDDTLAVAVLPAEWAGYRARGPPAVA